MTRRGTLLLVIIIGVITGCNLLSTKAEELIRNILDDFLLIEIDIRNDTTKNIGAHQELSYGPENQLTTLNVYESVDVTNSSFDNPDETRTYSYENNSIAVNIERATGENSDSLYVYNSDSVLIKIEFFMGDQIEMDTLYLNISGIPKETRHFSKGELTRVVKHFPDSLSGRVLIDSVFDASSSLIGISIHTYSSDSLRVKTDFYESRRGEIFLFQTDKFTYDSLGRLTTWENFQAGSTESLNWAWEYRFIESGIPESAVKIEMNNGIEVLIQHIAFTFIEKKSSSLAKMGTKYSKSNLSSKSSLGLSLYDLSVWELMSQRLEVEL